MTGPSLIRSPINQVSKRTNEALRYVPQTTTTLKSQKEALSTMQDYTDNTSGFVDNGSEESFVVLEDMARATQARSVSDFMSVTPETRASRHARRAVCRRMRDADSPAELTGVLLDLWRPETELLNAPCAEDVPYQQGRVVNVDVEDVLFTLEEDLKKLLSLIVYRRTGFAAKTAAIDVFTWMCSVDELMNNPVFSKHDVCKWLLGLLKREDDTTQSTALRGIRNLSQEEAYQDLLVKEDEFPRVLEYIKEGASQIKHADVYVFEICHSLLNCEDTLFDQGVFLERLLLRLKDETLSLEARVQGMQCLESCIQQLEDRADLLELLLERGDVLTWIETGKEAGLAATLDVVFTVLDQLPEDRMIALLNDMINSNDTMEKLRQTLMCGVSPMEAAILKLLLRMAAFLPNAMYDDYLDDLWIQFQIVLDNGSEENRQLVKDIIHALALAEGPRRKNKPLPLPDDGLPFVKLLVNDLNNQSFDILHFIWTKYEQVLPVVTEVQLVSALFSSLLETNWILTCDMEKVHSFLKEVLTQTADPQADFENCLLGFLKGAVDEENADTVHNALRIGLDLLVQLRKKSEALPLWILDDELIPFITTVMWSDVCLAVIDDPSNLFDILEAILLMVSLDPGSDISEEMGCALFIATLNSARVFGVDDIVDLLTSIKHQGCSCTFVPNFDHLPAVVTDHALSSEGWKVLQLLLEEWKDGENAAFLNSLLDVLSYYLSEGVDQGGQRPSVLPAFAGLVARISLDEMTKATRKLLISTMTVCSEKVHEEIADAVRASGQQTIENLWSLVMDTRGDSSDQHNGQPHLALLLLLKTVSAPVVHNDASQHVTNLLKENAELKHDIREKEVMIDNLQLQQQNVCNHQQSQSRMQETSRSAAGEDSDMNIGVTVRNLRRQLADKESAILGLAEQNQQLRAEIANREHAYEDLIELVDTQHDTISTLQTLLSDEGFELAIAETA